MSRAKKPFSGKHSKSSATGTNLSRRTDPELTRSERLLLRRQAIGSFSMRSPRLDRGAELRTAGILGTALLLAGVLLAAVVDSGAYGPESSLRLIFSFAIGLIGVCAVASGLTFMITLRHRLLLVCLAAAASAAGGIALGFTPLESVSKVLFAAAAGLWISLILTSVAQVLLIAGLIIVVDMYSVFLGPTRMMVESGGPWLDYLTISLPVFFVDATSRLGVSDIIFFSAFTGSALILELRRVETALAMTVSFLATMVIGVTGVAGDKGVPALPLLSIAFLLVNADLLYRRFLQEPDSTEPAGGEPADPLP